MAKPVKTQWDFGELFPPESLGPSRKVLSVSELTSQIRRLLEKEAGRIWVTGEITNLRLQNSGHMYFVLKDSGAQINCVLFRGELEADRSILQDGRKVVIGGGLTVYEARGQYQLRVTTIELQGLGALQIAFERLKQKLKAEGLFAQERKRPLPRYPRRVGLVTSPTGAAIRDILHVVGRRNPGLEIILAPCRVQGEGAAIEIAAAIRLLNQFNTLKSSRAPADAQFVTEPGQSGFAVPTQYLDLILVTRGGGSLEDLWAFNEEAVARAIFHSALPVVSAVGHEIDFTISDFVADLRAATPSAAAEIITEGVFASCKFVSEVSVRIGQLLRRQLQSKAQVLLQAGHRLARMHPRRRFETWLQRLDDLQNSLSRCVRQSARQHQLKCRHLAERMARVRPAFQLRQRREVFEQAQSRCREQTAHRVRELKNKLQRLEANLRLLGPEQVLARGYSITWNAETGRVLRSPDMVHPGQKLRTKLKQGEITSRVEPS